MNQIVRIYALFQYSDGVTIKVSFERNPRGLARNVDNKIIRPTSVYFSIPVFPKEPRLQADLINWIHMCNLAISLKPSEDSGQYEENRKTETSPKESRKLD